jgi:hypothetical protein
MADAKITTGTGSLADIANASVEWVTVYPTVEGPVYDDAGALISDVRKYLVHPLRNMAFPQEPGTGVQWPNDKFTARRLRDGDITREAPKAAEPAPVVAEEQAPTRRAAAKREE